MLTGDPCDPIFQVRLVIGDTNVELVSDEVISYALTNNNSNVRGASIEVLKYLLAYVANQMSHAVGDVWIDNKKLYDQLGDLLNKLLRDPAFLTEMGGIKIGGTSKTQINIVKTDSDIKSAPISVGDFT